MLLALLAMKPGPAVAFHSIIGSLRPVPLKNTSDGVVSYSSSHFDGAASEVVVLSDHWRAGQSAGDPRSEADLAGAHRHRVAAASTARAGAP